ncbi:MAG: hypothetical protein ACYTG0_16920 [Planctomycetota bacterium]
MSVAVPLAVAVITGVFLVIVAIVQGCGDGDVDVSQTIELHQEVEGRVNAAAKNLESVAPKKPLLSFEAVEEGELQSTNLPGEEHATFRFVVHNHGATAVCVSGGELVPSKVAFDSHEVHYLMAVWQIDHRGHISVPVHEPKVSIPIAVPLDFAVPPGKPHEFTLWFRLDSTTQESQMGFFNIEGRLTLHWDDGSVTSDPIEMSLCSMPKKDRRPQPERD